MSYDRAITVFSPDGHLFQVEYAMEAVKRGSAVVGVRATDCVVLGVERKAVAQLQDAVCHSLLFFTLLTQSSEPFARLPTSTTTCSSPSLGSLPTPVYSSGRYSSILNMRVMSDAIQARVEAQSFRLTCEDAPSPEYMARFIAKTQQSYTQRGGVRPFGVSSMIAGFSNEGAPQLYLTDPAGTYSAWKVG